MAARILAKLIGTGTGIVARAFMQTYRQVLANSSKNAIAQKAMQNIRKGSKVTSEAEARQILGISENSTQEEILQNVKNGNFHLQSKVHRDKECVESIHPPKNWAQTERSI